MYIRSMSMKKVVCFIVGCENMYGCKIIYLQNTKIFWNMFPIFLFNGVEHSQWKNPFPANLPCYEYEEKAYRASWQKYIFFFLELRGNFSNYLFKIWVVLNIFDNEGSTWAVNNKLATYVWKATYNLKICPNYYST